MRRLLSFNKVSLNLALTFKARLPGPQKIFMPPTDGSGQSQYQTMSTWTTTTVNSQGPSAVSVSPNPGVPAMTQAFTYTARSVNGWDYIANPYMKLSPTPARDQACILPQPLGRCLAER